MDTSEDELKDLFSKEDGYKRMFFRQNEIGPICFVQFEDDSFATKALNELHGHQLHNSISGGILLRYSGSSLGFPSSLASDVDGRSTLNNDLTIERHSPLEDKSQVSFEGKTVTRTTHLDRGMYDDVFESDKEDEIGEFAIDNNYDSLGWKDSIEDYRSFSIDRYLRKPEQDLPLLTQDRRYPHDLSNPRPIPVHNRTSVLGVSYSSVH